MEYTIKWYLNVTEKIFALFLLFEAEQEHTSRWYKKETKAEDATQHASESEN